MTLLQEIHKLENKLDDLLPHLPKQVQTQLNDVKTKLNNDIINNHNNQNLNKYKEWLTDTINKFNNPLSE